MLHARVLQWGIDWYTSTIGFQCPGPTPSLEEERMKRELPLPVVIAIIIIVVAVIGVAGYIWMNREAQPPPKPTGPAPTGGQQMVEPQV